jgi:hypothetical protein
MDKENLPILTFLFGVLVVFVTFTGCTDPHAAPDVSNPHRMELDNSAKYFDQNYKVYTLEGCEYIVVGAGRSQWGSHKGNCKNKIHKQNGSN